MRKYRNFALFVALIATTLFTSCKDKNDENDGYVVYAMGDIIKRDNNTITVLENEYDTVLLTNAGGLKLNVGKRIQFMGEPILEQKNGKYKYWEVKVLDLDTVLTKAPLLKSVLEADSKLDKEVGNDKIFIYENSQTGRLSASTSLNKYLDIIFTVPTGNMGVSHFINLEVDDSEPFDGTKPLKVKLRHNAFGDIGSYVSHSYVSFRMDKYMDIVKNMSGDDKKMDIIISYGDNRTFTVTWKPDVPEKALRSNMSRYNILNSSVKTQ